MSKPANVFSGGWTPEKAAKLLNIQLPDKTRCKGCHKLKALGLYSNKQLTDLRQRIAGPQGEKAKAPTAEIITCRTCTSGQIQELTCFICCEAKGLEAFGKTQRKNPDTARCILCVHEQGIQKWADRDWQDEDSAGEVSDEDGHSRTATTNPYETSSYQRDDAVSAVSSALKEVNLAAHNNAYDNQASKTGSTVITQSDLLGSYSEIGGFSGTSGNDKGKGKEKENATPNWQNFAATQRRDEPVEFTGYDAKGGAQRQVRSPSTVASERSVEIVTDRPRGRSGPSQPKGGKHQFARVPRGPSPELRKDSMITALKAGATGRTVSYSDDEDTDDEWGTV
ncbi:MAG: hypothetical protein LQ343_000424 [Gyalolechia ehrenbergii]|nr:MAG: hypothetical protein LQ343_000424 [Gyalolechia ehrenbergii]